jgi:hypothetical protein
MNNTHTFVPHVCYANPQPSTLNPKLLGGLVCMQTRLCALSADTHYIRQALRISHFTSTLYTCACAMCTCVHMPCCIWHMAWCGYADETVCIMYDFAASSALRTIMVNLLALKFRDLLPEWHVERAHASFAHSAEAQALRRGLCSQSSNIFQWRYAFESNRLAFLGHNLGGPYVVSLITDLETGPWKQHTHLLLNQRIR